VISRLHELSQKAPKEDVESTGRLLLALPHARKVSGDVITRTLERAAVAEANGNGHLFRSAVTVVLEYHGDPAAAEKHARNDVSTSASPAAKNNLAWLLAAYRSQADAGVRLVDEAILAGGPESAFLDTRGFCLMSVGRKREAAVALNAATIGGRVDVGNHLHLAEACRADGDEEAARHAWRTFATRRPLSMSPRDRKVADTFAR
jgi:hypothetical protein